MIPALWTVAALAAAVTLYTAWRLGSQAADRYLDRMLTEAFAYQTPEELDTELRTLTDGIA